MIMQCRMASWTIFIIVAQQNQEHYHCEPDAHFVVVKVILVSTGFYIRFDAKYFLDLDCGTMRACAEDDTASMDELDAHIYVCETELCNDNCEGCGECYDPTTITPTTTSPDIMCYVCDVRDPECKISNGKITEDVCSSGKCLISGQVL